MGLSNTERTRGIYHHIHRITAISQKLEAEQGEIVSKIKELCSGLWHDFLGKNNNSSHWMLGSSAENKVSWESTSPWGIAVLYGIQEVCEKESIWDSLPFDIKEDLRIPAILRYSGNRKISLIFEIYSHLESVIYNLRRYDDKYLESHARLSKTVSTLMGYCYSLFTEEKELCAKAYLLHQISEMLLIYPYTKEMESETGENGCYLLPVSQTKSALGLFRGCEVQFKHRIARSLPHIQNTPSFPEGKDARYSGRDRMQTICSFVYLSQKHPPQISTHTSSFSLERK